MIILLFHSETARAVLLTLPLSSRQQLPFCVMLGFAILDQEAFQNLKIILFQSAITNTVEYDKQKTNERGERENKKKSTEKAV